MALCSYQDQKEEYKIRAFQRFLDFGAHKTILPVPLLEKINWRYWELWGQTQWSMNAYLLVGQGPWVTGYIIDIGILFSVARNAFSTRVVAPSQLRIPEITGCVHFCLYLNCLSPSGLLLKSNTAYWAEEGSYFVNTGLNTEISQCNNLVSLHKKISCT